MGSARTWYSYYSALNDDDISWQTWQEFGKDDRAHLAELIDVDPLVGGGVRFGQDQDVTRRKGLNKNKKQLFVGPYTTVHSQHGEL